MITTLNPAYQCPSRSTLANQLIPAWYEQVKTQLVYELGVQPESAKYMHGSWRTKAVYTSQTGEAVSIEIEDVLNDFGVRDKVK